ncbi:avidin-like isoform X1 [Pelodiscus sinensis]|uniref:avidin-like isoform X1 n=1 Tax=Pelodiscus sinensis TaxID=13735 RepID=UPI003F6D45B0
MGGIGVSLSIVLALVTLSSSDAGSGDPQKTKCDLSGLWRNELGSLMEIHDVNEAGEFSGEYLTAVTATSNCIQNSPLKGAQHHTKAETSPVFGFTVNWEFSNSTTVFVGQCFMDARGNETLKTTWLLREEVGSLGDDWGATRVGTNDFTRELKLVQIPQNHSPQCGTPAPLSP